MPNPYTSGGLLPHMPDSWEGPATQAPQTQLVQPLGQDSPFGPMNDGSLSSRGGPMSYSIRGVGTNNPNAYKVGQNNKPTGLRLLERAARRRDPRAIQMLAGIEANQADSSASRNQRWEELMFGAGREDTRDSRRIQHENTIWDRNVQRDDSVYGRMRTDKLTDEQRRIEQENQIYGRMRTDKLTDEQRNAEEARKTYSVIDPLTGQPHKGHFMTGNNMVLPSMKPEPTPEQLKAEEDYWKSQGLQVNEAKGSQGTVFRRPEVPKNTESTSVETDAEGKVIKRTTRSNAPAGATAKNYTTGLF